MKRSQNTSTLLQVMTFLLMLSSSIGVVSAHADEVAIPVGHQGAEKDSLERPKVGMTSIAVESKFGAPLKKSSPVGTPPISSWEYPHFNVYFESDRVIHSVLKPFIDETTAPAAAVVEQAPAPVQTPALTEPTEVEATEATK